MALSAAVAFDVLTDSTCPLQAADDSRISLPFRNTAMVSPKIRGCRLGSRPAFSLLELIVVLCLSIVLLAVYVRAMEEAETVDREIQTDSLPRLARSGGPRPVQASASVSAAAADLLAEAEPDPEGSAVTEPTAGVTDEITGTATSDQ